MNSTEFEEKLQLSNFNLLEEEFQKAKKYFNDLQDKITSDELEKNFPAFCFGNQEIIIKFPTYKIRVIDNQIDYEDLERFLEGKGNFKIYEETNVVRRSSGENVYSIAIHCLENDLKTNTQTAEKVQKELIKNGVRFERCVTLGLYCIPIEVDDKGYLSIKRLK